MDMALFVGALAGILFGLSAALGLTFTAMLMLIVRPDQSAVGLLWWAAGLAVVGLCGLPLAYRAGKAALGQDFSVPGHPSRSWAWLAAVFPAAIALGYLAFQQDVLPEVLGPLAQILAAGIPVGLVAVVARRQAPPARPIRIWGQFLSGLWIAPAAALLVELILLVPIGFAVALGLLATPTGSETLMPLLQAPAPSAEMIEPAELLLSQPWILAVALVYIAVLVPLTEEALKTVAVWPFLRSSLSEAEAFLGGVLGGAGYALFEALFLPQPGSEWAVTMISRVGTTLMHAFTAGIAARGLVAAAAQRRPARFATSYLAACALHGIWNAVVVGVGVTTLILPEMSNTSLAETLESLVSSAGVVAVAALSLLALIGLLWMGRRARRSSATS
jgi:hypothetical protein